MTLTATEYKYVELDEKNVPLIAGTTMKVVELVQAHIAYGWNPAELYLNHRYLTMSQIHSAFAYYWDHKQELDADMQRRFEVDVLTVQDDGRTGMPDPMILDRAIELQRVVFTQDQNFLAIANRLQQEAVNFGGVMSSTLSKKV